MHGLIFETSVWLLAESTRLLLSPALRTAQVWQQDRQKAHTLTKSWVHRKPPCTKQIRTMCNLSSLLTQVSARHKQPNAYINSWDSVFIEELGSPITTTVSDCSIKLYAQQKYKSTSITIQMYSGTFKLDFLRLQGWWSTWSLSTLTKRLDGEDLLILPCNRTLTKPILTFDNK